MPLPFSRTVSRPGPRRRRNPSGQAPVRSPEPRQGGMGISVQPVHGHHCICERCQRQTGSR